MTKKQIFAHASGGTYRFEESIVQFSPSTKARVRKPVAVVSDATREAERSDNAYAIPHRKGTFRVSNYWRCVVYSRIANMVTGAGVY